MSGEQCLPPTNVGCSYYSSLNCSQELVSPKISAPSHSPQDQFLAPDQSQNLTCQESEPNNFTTYWNNSAYFKLNLANPSYSSHPAASLLVYFRKDQSIPLGPDYYLNTRNGSFLLFNPELKKEGNRYTFLLDESEIYLKEGAALPHWLLNRFEHPKVYLKIKEGELILDNRTGKFILDLLIGKKRITDQILPFLPESIQKEKHLPSTINSDQIADWIETANETKSPAEDKKEDQKNNSFFDRLFESIESIWANVRFQPIDIHRKDLEIVFNQNPEANDIPITIETEGVKKIRSVQANGIIDLQKLMIPGLINLGKSFFGFNVDVDSKKPSSASLDNFQLNLNPTGFLTHGRISSSNLNYLSVKKNGIDLPSGIRIDGEGIEKFNVKGNLDIDLTFSVPWIGEMSIKGPLLFYSQIQKSDQGLFSYQIIPQTTFIQFPDLSIEWGEKTNTQKIKGEVLFTDIPSLKKSSQKDDFQLSLKVKEGSLFTQGEIDFSLPIPIRDGFYSLDDFKNNPQATAKILLEKPNKDQWRGNLKVESHLEESKSKSQIYLSLNEFNSKGKIISPLIEEGELSLHRTKKISDLQTNQIKLRTKSFLGIADFGLDALYDERNGKSGIVKWQPKEFKLFGNQNGSIAHPILNGPFSVLAEISPEQKPTIIYNSKTGELKIEEVDISLDFKKIYPPALLEETAGRIKGFNIHNLHLVADGIFNTRKYQWNGVLALKGSNEGDLFPLNKNGDPFEAPLDPQHPERLYSIPLFRNSEISTQEISEEYPYWYHGIFKTKTEVDLFPLFDPETNIHQAGEFEFKFHDLPKPTTIKEAVHAFYQRVLDRLNAQPKKESPLIENHPQPEGIKIPKKVYAENWLSPGTPLYCLPKVTIKGRMEGIKTNGGEEGCRYPDSVLKSYKGPVSCNIFFKKNTKTDLNIEIASEPLSPEDQTPAFLQSRRAWLKILQLIYQPNLSYALGPITPPIVEGLFIYNKFTSPCGTEICGDYSNVFQSTESPNQTLRKSFTAPLRPLSMKERALQFRLMAHPLHHTTKIDIGGEEDIFNVTKPLLQKFGLDDPKTYETHDIPLYTLSPYLNEMMVQFSDGTTDENKILVRDPNKGIKPPLFDFLDFDQATVDYLYLDDCEMAFPGAGKVSFSRASAQEEYKKALEEFNKIRIDNKEPELSFSRLITYLEQKKGTSKYQKLFRKLQELEQTTSLLRGHTNSNETVFTFSNVELPEIEFSNENYLVKAKGVKAKKVEVTFPYSFTHLVQLIKQGDFDWTQLGIKIEGDSPHSGATIEEATYQLANGFIFHLQKEEGKENSIQLRFHQVYNRTTKKTDQEGEILIEGKLKDLTLAQGNSFKVQFSTATPQKGSILFRTPLSKNRSESPPLPIFDIAGDLKLQAGSLKIADETFNFPGLQANGSIENIHFQGNFHLQSTGNSLVLENSSPPEKQERFRLYGTLKGVVVDLNHLLTPEGEKLREWKGSEIVKSHLELAAQTLEIGNLQRMELQITSQPHLLKKETTYSFNIHELEAYDISMRQITGKEIRWWKSMLFWEFLSGYFSSVGTLERSLALLIDPSSTGPKESFFKLGAILMCNKDGKGICRERPPQFHSDSRIRNYNKPITDLKGLVTELYGIGDDQHLILKIPELMIMPKGERIVTLPNGSFDLQTRMKDDIREGEIRYRTIRERKLEGLPYRVVPR